MGVETHVEWAMAFANGRLASSVVSDTDARAQNIGAWASMWSHECHLVRRVVTSSSWVSANPGGT